MRIFDDIVGRSQHGARELGYALVSDVNGEDLARLASDMAPETHR